MTQVLSPAVSLLSIWPCHDYLRRWDSQQSCGSSSWVKFCQFSRCLHPKIVGRPGKESSTVRTPAHAGASGRWNLDDVERLSRGRPSKSKLGSRGVPHRLNAEERKAFELAKKKGYLVQQANGRRYPLINTYRNYCDAVGLPSIHIKQGAAGSPDQVVIDLTPLHLTEVGYFTLRQDFLKAITLMSTMSNDQTTASELALEDDEQDDSSRSPWNIEDGSMLNKVYDEHLLEPILSDALERSSQPLRFQVSSRSMTKVISQTALDTWRRLLRSDASKLTK